MPRFFLHGQAIILVIISAPPIKQVSISNKFAQHSLLQQFEKVSLNLSGLEFDVTFSQPSEIKTNKRAFCSRRDLADTDNARPDNQILNIGIELCYDMYVENKWENPSLCQWYKLFRGNKGLIKSWIKPEFLYQTNLFDPCCWDNILRLEYFLSDQTT